MQPGSWGGKLARPFITIKAPGKEEIFGGSTTTHFPALGVLQLTDPSTTLV